VAAAERIILRLRVDGSGKVSGPPLPGSRMAAQGRAGNRAGGMTAQTRDSKIPTYETTAKVAVGVAD
jgi:hypothetical protein